MPVAELQRRGGDLRDTANSARNRNLPFAPVCAQRCDPPPQKNTTSAAQHMTPGSKHLTLGLDVGTQGVKALVYDTTSGQVVGRGTQVWEVLASDVPGRAEQHPATWIEVRWLKQVLACLPACGGPCCSQQQQQRQQPATRKGRGGGQPPIRGPNQLHTVGAVCDTGHGQSSPGSAVWCGRQRRGGRGRQRAAARHGGAGRGGQRAASCKGLCVLRSV